MAPCANVQISAVAEPIHRANVVESVENVAVLAAVAAADVYDARRAERAWRRQQMSVGWWQRATSTAALRCFARRAAATLNI